MRIFDISAELRSASVWPDDTKTELTTLKSFERGDGYNLTALSQSLHTGTHIDAPLHFVDGGKAVSDIELTNLMGECTVVSCIGMREHITGADIEKMVPYGFRRVLFKTLGEVQLTRSAVFALVAAGITLVGIDGPSIAVDYELAAVHRELGLAGITVLEGLSLRHVQSGTYTLFALPLKISGTEAAPVRAVLLGD